MSEDLMSLADKNKARLVREKAKREENPIVDEQNNQDREDEKIPSMPSYIPNDDYPLKEQSAKKKPEKKEPQGTPVVDEKE